MARCLTLCTSPVLSDGVCVVWVTSSPRWVLSSLALVKKSLVSLGWISCRILCRPADVSEQTHTKKSHSLYFLHVPPLYASQSIFLPYWYFPLAHIQWNIIWFPSILEFCHLFLLFFILLPNHCPKLPRELNTLLCRINSHLKLFCTYKPNSFVVHYCFLIDRIQYFLKHNIYLKWKKKTIKLNDNCRKILEQNTSKAFRVLMQITVFWLSRIKSTTLMFLWPPTIKVVACFALKTVFLGLLKRSKFL